MMTNKNSFDIIQEKIEFKKWLTKELNKILDLRLVLIDNNNDEELARSIDKLFNEYYEKLANTTKKESFIELKLEYIDKIAELCY